MKIGKRMALCFGVILFMMLMVVAVAFYNMNSIQDNLDRIVKVNSVSLSAVNNLSDDIREVSIISRNLFLIKGEDEEFLKRIDRHRTRLGESIKKLEELTSKDDTKGVELLARIKQEISVARDFNNKIFEFIKSGNHAEAQKILLTSARSAMRNLLNTTDEYAKYQFKRTEDHYAIAVDSKNNSIIIMAVWGGIATLLAIFLGIYLTRSITVPLQKSVELADKIASGDLTAANLNISSKDEMGHLAASLNKMRASLSGLISKFADTAHHVASASGELSATVMQITKRVQEQSAKTTQVATASVEMSQTVIDIAKNTANIATSTAETQQTAESGARVVEQTVTEVGEIAHTVDSLSGIMNTLGTRSQQIGEIIGVIRDIADQTNLLALNAAIEAARAGEQGRGFAVVADEVRKLAEKTANATSEIEDMIKAIQSETQNAVTSMNTAQTKVEDGVSLASKAGEGLGKIVSGVRDLQSMAQQIASATEEMSTVSEQISSDIELVADVSRETKESSSQIGKEAERLSKLSEELLAEVQKVKLR
jgi:methyl-accepting chemotaxis protein